MNGFRKDMPDDGKEISGSPAGVRGCPYGQPHAGVNVYHRQHIAAATIPDALDGIRRNQI